MSKFRFGSETANMEFIIRNTENVVLEEWEKTFNPQSEADKFACIGAAALKGFKELLGYMIQGYDHVTQYQKDWAMENAYISCHYDIVEMMLDEGAKASHNMLRTAWKRNDVETLEKMGRTMKNWHEKK